MSFSINTGNIWTPSASDLTSTDGNGDLFDRDKLPKPDLETEQNMITKADQSAKYAGNVGAWSRTDAYGNNGYAFEVARNYLFINRVGTNTIQGEEKNREIQMQQGRGKELFELA